MPIIKVKDVAFGRLQAPDLDAQEEFLTHFGMVKVERTKNKLFMRGTGPAHHLHVTELGDSPKLIGFAFYAKNEDDLKKIATAPGASGIENIDEPGGGKRVRLTEPNGYQIEVVAGIPDAKPIHVDRQPINWRENLFERTGDLMRLKREPAHVMRMGHAVLGSPKVVDTVKWYRDVLGLICSDDVYAGDKNNVIGSFNRCDNGDDYVDHHVFFCAMNPKAGLNHFSYEVEDIDDVFIGHEYLRSLDKYEHMWGIGRHLLGSQVYDYWADPWGRVHEHWTDSDRLNTKNGSNLLPVETGFSSQWGEPPPEKFIHHVSP
jgi:catechol 2,3-dioxygenase-like lactoylglutathione lyase family enzyme